jgi:uncharacterized protein (TIGR00297 family)
MYFGPELALPLVLGAAAFFSKALDARGTVAALVLGYALLLRQNIYWLLALLLFFALGSAATMVKAEYKRKYGLYQRIRSVQNVIGNGAIAVIMALTGQFHGFIGALSTATADTLSSELGVLSRTKPILITNLKPVRTGTNGGVSALGTMCGVVGSAVIGYIAWLISGSAAAFSIGLLSGVFGCFIDSVVGAMLENRGLTKNWSTNLIATIAGAFFAIGLSHFL